MVVRGSNISDKALWDFFTFDPIEYGDSVPQLTKLPGNLGADA